MRKLTWLSGFLLVTGLILWAIVELTAKSKTLADVTSPSGEWRVVVRGKQLLSGGIEVTANVHTHDGRIRSLGVIDLCQEWGDTEYDYKAQYPFHTRIDETKAVVGSMIRNNHRLLFRDDYFPEEDNFIFGAFAGDPVKLRIGRVDVTGFHFWSGVNALQRPSLWVLIADVAHQLAAGKTFEVNEDQSYIRGINFDELDSKNDQPASDSHITNYTMHLEVETVTEYVVTGNLTITSSDPQVQLSGQFRIVNGLADFLK